MTAAEAKGRRTILAVDAQTTRQTQQVMPETTRQTQQVTPETTRQGETQSVELFGPFHRKESTTQTAATAQLQEQNHELWGRARRGGMIPQVQAYDGPLPSGARGVEFFTVERPASGTAPGYASWFGIGGKRTAPTSAGVVTEGDWAKIKVAVTKNTQT